jgi:hypothetical protein
MDEKATNEEGKAAAGPRLERLKGFVKQHPGAALLVGTSAGLLLGPEFALGAALGVGATLLLSETTGQETREQLRRQMQSLYDAGRKLPEQLRARGKQMFSRKRDGAGGEAPREPGH